MTRVEEIERTWEDAGCPEGNEAVLLQEIQRLQKENILLWEFTRPIRESTITNRLEAIDQRTVGHPFGFVEVLRPDYNWLRWKASGAEKAEAELDAQLTTYQARVKEIDKLEAELGEYRRLFDLQESRMKKAIKLWQKATGKTDTLPDLGDLLDWLMIRIKELEESNKTLAGLALDWLQSSRAARGNIFGPRDKVDYGVAKRKIRALQGEEG